MSECDPRLVRAAYTSDTITVYQAYSSEIADAAGRAGAFVQPFSRDRMTWIKPSFGWMMHRSGWASKPGQERILAIQLIRAGFEWALAHSCLSDYQPAQHDSPQAWAALKESSPVRIQWDPDRSLSVDRLAIRAIQVGLSGEAVRRYCEEWVCSITDITATVRRVSRLVRDGRIAEAAGEVPAERVYPLSAPVAQRIGAEPGCLESANLAARER
ncbi:MAG: DUF4291 domain-containing protein [Nocardiopsaceae bacterium]|jgi:hypothetical protein|nr:DUF4291 domain-containing protein [Nocardiopsaceae bacterium]